MRSLRVFLIGGFISYKALFHWIHPASFIPSMLGLPLFQILFFVYLGRVSGLGDDNFFVVGNAVHVCSLSSVFGMTQAIGNERYYGTLSPLLVTPTNRLVLFFGRGLPFVANGLLVSAFGFATGALLLDLNLALRVIPSVAIVITAAAISSTAFGLTVGAIGLRVRDPLFLANLLYFLMLLVCGVNVPAGDLPVALVVIGKGLPLTNGIAAARELAGGASFASVADLITMELGIGLIYAITAYLLITYFEAESRHRATLDTT